MYSYRSEILRIPTHPKAGMRFGAVMDEWLESRRNELKQTTFSTYRCILDNHIRPALGVIMVRRLTENDILAYLDSISGEESGLSAATVRGIENELHQILVYAAKHGCRVDPEVCHCPRTTTKHRVEVLSPAETERLLETLGDAPSGLDLGVLISLKTGLRVGEVCALRWEDIDTENGVLSVKRTVQRINSPDNSGTVLYLGQPKSAESMRKIPLPPSLAKTLAKRKPFCQGYILSKKGDTPEEPRCLQRHFKRVLRRAGLRDVNYHVLRHTFATNCVDKGFDVKSLSMILGHASVSTTMNTYVHPSMERMRSMMAMIDE